MKVSLNWLRELVDFNQDADALAALLTRAGVEVEGIQRRGVDLPKVVVAQILASEQHPNADRLSVCRVDDGSGEPLQIVCGAKNYKVGDKVLLAQAGALLPGDFAIRVGKLRGVESQGMMCSAKELGLSEDSAGLLILDPVAAVGTPVGALFPADTVFDVEITPNRSDLLSHEGIAREVGALGMTKWKAASQFQMEAAAGLSPEIPAAGCSLYTVRQFTSVKVGPSPEAMRQRLESLGVRAINNVVDITNLVMLEMGQPLHAFDADKVRGSLRVRLARAGESLLALDGKTYALEVEDLVIADDSGPVAIAGVMGGESTAVDATSTRLLLESALFDASRVRRTARRLGLSSESSYRFERGVDPAGTLRASQRAAQLLQELCHAQAGQLAMAASGSHLDAEALLMGLIPVCFVPLRLDRVAALLGAPVAEARINEILTALGLIKSEGGWEVPSHRADLKREVDLIEEIARVVGMEYFPATTRAHFSNASAADARYDRLMALRGRAVAQGLFEARSLTLVSEAMAQGPFVTGSVRRVRNPLNEEQVILRGALVPGLLEAAARNARAGVRRIRLFEVGRVFSGDGVEERMHLGVVLAGAAREASWREASTAEVDLHELKGVLSEVLSAEVEFESIPAEGNLVLAVKVVVAGEVLGVAGWIRPSEARAMDISGAVVAAEVALDGLLGLQDKPGAYKELPRFPAVTRDIALVAPVDLQHGRVVAELLAGAEPLLEGVQLFDVFTDESGVRVPVGFKSLAYSLTYRSIERTLTAEEVNAAHARLKQRLSAVLGVQARE